MPALTPLAESLWVAHSRHRFMGTELGTRMTLVRLSDGHLWVHSPIALSDSLRGQIEALGTVRHVVAPNLYHHMYAGPCLDAWPGARLHGAPGLARKRRDLHFESELGDAPPPAWADDLDQTLIRGTLLHETVFLHRASRTLVSSDLVENFATSDHWPTRVYLKLAGIHGRPGLSRMLRLLFRDRRAARAGIDRVLAWDFDRIVLAHGDVIERGGKDVLRATYTWLRA